MIILHGFGKKIGLVDASPFVVKVDLFLRLAGIPYQCDNDLNNVKNSPKGKLPFITDTENTKEIDPRHPDRDNEGSAIISDSSHIVDYLTKKYSVNLDAFLTEEEKAEGHLLAKTLDEHLRWCLMYSRWVLEDSWAIIHQAFFNETPFPFKSFIPKLVRKNVIKSLNTQGIARHSTEEVLSFTEETLNAISVLLADKLYIFGSNICSFDSVLYGHLSQFISAEIDNEFNQLARKYDNLVAYCQRIEKHYY